MPDVLLDIHAKTDVGLVRTNNEDNFIVTSELGSDNWVVPQEAFSLSSGGCAFIVADGMGGASAGEIASELAVQGIRLYLDEKVDPSVSGAGLISIMEQALIVAHKMVVKYGVDNPDSFGLGTTATICVVKDDMLYISWIGDSRVYRYNSKGRVTDHSYSFGDLEILTNDHSVVWDEVLAGKLTPEQARVAQHSNIITQSLGDAYKIPSPESKTFPLYKGDLIISCSDGLNGELSDVEINSIVESHVDLEQLSDQLIHAAKAAGGKDNITLALCSVLEGPDFIPVELSQRIENENQTIEVREDFMERSVLFPLMIISIVGALAFGGFYLWKSYNQGLMIKSEKKVSESLDENLDESMRIIDTSNTNNKSAAVFEKVISEKKKDERKTDHRKADDTKTNMSRIETIDSKQILDESLSQSKEIPDHYVSPEQLEKEKEILAPKFIGEDPEIRSLLNSIADIVMENDSMPDRHRQKWREFNEECNTQIRIDDLEAKENMMATLKKMYERVSK